ncbi:MAG: hypothetical protein GWP47_10805 [Actinobacteria bacterium]|nr:hypothetical protein [Actinomycetota bacterium]NCG38236.1 hypothetical protein [Actinomycetota bacterium]
MTGVVHGFRWGTRVERWFDEELGDDRAERVLSHIDGCANCRSAAAEYACIKRAFARMEKP